MSEATAALEEALRLDPLLASARRMLGVTQAAAAQFDDALDTWDAWSRLDSRPPAEDARGGTVSRLRSAVSGLPKESALLMNDHE